MIKLLPVYLLVILLLTHLAILYFLRKERKKAQMAKNIFEELIGETEKILGGSFRIMARTEGCEFCFKHFKKNQIIRALQNTAIFVKENAGLKKFVFVFKDEEIKDVFSLASVFLKLACSGMQSIPGSHFTDRQDFLECFGCQMTLFRTAEYFTAQLILEKRRGGPTLIKKIVPEILKQIFISKTEKKFYGVGITLLAVPCSSFPLIFGLKTLINSREKWEILQKYSPLFKEKEIEPEKVIKALAKATEGKNKDLEPEEFEETLKDLLEIK